MNTHTDNKVVDIATWSRESREQTVDRLMREHGTALRGFLCARIIAQQDVDDVIQEVFLKLTNMEDLKQRVSPQSGSNRAFILTLANNLMVDMERRQATQHHYRNEYQQELGNPIDSISPEARAEAQQQLQQVKQAILDLPPKWRQVFVLSRFEHKSYQQIANMLGVSTKQIEKYMSKALVRVRAAGCNFLKGENND